MRTSLVACALMFVACGHEGAILDGGTADLSTLHGPDVPDGSVALPDLGTDPYGPYDRVGPFAVTRTSISVTHGTSSYMAELHLTDAPGPRPVVLLSPGLLQPAAAYRPYAERLASHGVIVIVRDDPGLLVQTPTVTADLVDLATSWLTDANAGSGPLGGRVDLSRIGLAGHSRGGKASLMAAEGGLHGKLKGWFGLDPVDSSVLAGSVAARDGIAASGIPTAFMGAQVSSSCSPAADNYMVLFAAAPSPTVALPGLGAGPHAIARCGVLRLLQPVLARRHRRRRRRPSLRSSLPHRVLRPRALLRRKRRPELRRRRKPTSPPTESRGR